MGRLCAPGQESKRGFALPEEYTNSDRARDQVFFEFARLAGPRQSRWKSEVSTAARHGENRW